VSVYSGGDIYTADFCIVALPFPAVSKIALDPAPTGAQRSAIETLPYTQIVRLYLEPEQPFWKEDGLAPAMWTNGPLERIFPIRDPDTNEISCLQPWLNGDHARAVAKLSDDEIEAVAQKEMKRLRPASDGRVKLLRAVRWTDEASYAGGAYMHWAPGQVGAWADIMGAPLGRIHFAGEHLSYRHTGIEGAMESGEYSAKAVIAASA
jgi:monoamine oxidase